MLAMKPSNNFRRRERILIKRVDAENGARRVDEYEESHLGKFLICITCVVLYKSSLTTLLIAEDFLLHKNLLRSILPQGPRTS